MVLKMYSILYKYSQNDARGSFGTLHPINIIKKSCIYDHVWPDFALSCFTILNLNFVKFEQSFKIYVMEVPATSLAIVTGKKIIRGKGISKKFSKASSTKKGGMETRFSAVGNCYEGLPECYQLELMTVMTHPFRGTRFLSASPSPVSNSRRGN